MGGTMPNKLYEFVSYDQGKMVVEDKQMPGGSKTLCMQGIFIQGNIRNQNQRVYPENEISTAVNAIRDKINNGYSVLGELDHPEELSINLDRVSHTITDMWMEGSDGYGKLEIVPTPMGNIVKTLLESGVKLGVSSRGSGNVNPDGGVSDYEIVTVDIVSQPSAPSAYPRTIYESLFNMTGGSSIIETAREAHIDRRADKQLAKDLVKLIDELNKK